MRNLLNDFKKFIMRGNVIDLAVAVIVGGAFNAVVQSLVKNVVTPIIGAIGGNPDFSKLSFEIHNSEFRYGQFLTDLVSFLIVAASVFLMIKVFEALQKIRGTSADADPVPLTVSEELLTEIRNLLASEK